MIITAQGSTYIWKGGFAERSIPEAAGFLWTEPGQWTTQRHGIAAKLAFHFDDAATALADRAAASASIGSDFPVPTPVGRVLLPYQRAGIHTLATRLAAGTNCLLADEMRLGKTIQVAGLINVMPDILRVLVVCPATLKLDWRDKLQNWLTVPFSIGVVWPHSQEIPYTSIIIVNYDLLHRFVWPEVDLIVIDEAHMVKNPKARRSKKAFVIRSKMKLALTGTPIPSRPIEGFSVFNWLAPDIFYSREDFGTRYCDGFCGEHGWDFTGSSNPEELHDWLISTIMVRRLRSEVWKDLPPVRREVVELLSGARTLRREQKFWSALAGNYEGAVSGLKTAHQVAFECQSVVRHETAIFKIPQLIDFIKEALSMSDEKIVVFGWHTDVIDGLMEGLIDYCPVVVNGNVPVNKRQGIEAAFRSDPQCRVFIGNIVAAGMGLDLSISSRIIFAELDWVPGNMKQCEDRCQHPDKRDPILSQHVVLEGSIDACMARALVKKQDVLDRTVDGKQDEPLAWAEVFAGAN